MSIEKLKPIYGLRNYLTENIEYKQSNFLGQVLTIIDASISDKEQRKGIKNLIQNDFYRDRKYTRVREILLAFCEKYCPDTVPVTKETRDNFLGIYNDVLNGPSDPMPEEWEFEK